MYSLFSFRYISNTRLLDQPHWNVQHHLQQGLWRTLRGRNGQLLQTLWQDMIHCWSKSRSPCSFSWTPNAKDFAMNVISFSIAALQMTWNPSHLPRWRQISSVWLHFCFHCCPLSQMTLHFTSVLLPQFSWEEDMRKAQMLSHTTSTVSYNMAVQKSLLSKDYASLGLQPITTQQLGSNGCWLRHAVKQFSSSKLQKNCSSTGSKNQMGRFWLRWKCLICLVRRTRYLHDTKG